MLDELTYAQQMLTRGNYTLLLCAGGRVYFSEERGIRPLLELTGSEEWRGAVAADKIVGRAAAMLYVLLGVGALYAEVLSRPALELLTAHGVECRYGTLTDNIINRQGTDLCPMELAVRDVQNPSDAPAAIRAKIKSMHHSKTAG